MISREELEGMEIEDFIGVYTVSVGLGCSIYWVQRHERFDDELGGTRVWPSGEVWESGWWRWEWRFHEDVGHFRTLEDVLEYFGEGEALKFVEKFL